jgi:hypothetical protein
VCCGVVAAGEVAGPLALDLDHPGAGVGQPRCAERRRDGLFQRDDQRARERARIRRSHNRLTFGNTGLKKI